MSNENTMDRFDKILLKYFQGKSDKEDLKELDEFIQDTENKNTFKDFFKVWLWTGQMKGGEPKVPFLDTWDKILLGEQNTRVVNFRQLFAYAATILILINMGWWGGKIFYDNKAESSFETYQITSNQFDNSTITLPDQTLVHLRKGSYLKYDSRFNKKDREVLLEGEAFFEVAHNQEKPFIVKVSDAEVRVLGTKFNVFAEKGSNIYQTTLVEGKVAFSTKQGKSYVLKPSQMIEYNKEKKSIKIKSVNTELYTAWTDGKIMFRDESLGEIVKKLERIYHVQFVFNNPELATKYHFSGTFNKETSIGDVIKMLKSSMPLKVKRVEKFPERDIIYME